MWYQPQVWAQSLNNAVLQANEKKKSQTSGYEWFQILFYVVHMIIGVVGIMMFIYGVGFDVEKTYTITLVDEIDYNAVFLSPAILSGITIAFSFSMVLQFTNGYKKHLLGVYMVLVIASIVTCSVLWKTNMTLNSRATKDFNANNKFKEDCMKYCAPTEQ